MLQLSSSLRSDGVGFLNGFDFRKEDKVKFGLRIVGLLLVGILTGCGGRQADYGSLNLVNVSGKVTLNGEPLAGVNVLFEDEQGSYSFGTTDENGEYSLEFNSEKSGCTPGKKKVRITTGPLGDDVDSGEIDPDAPKKKTKKTTIPARYNQRTELVADVSSSSRSFSFDLKSS